MEVYGFVPLGYEGELVRVEVDIRRGIPAVEVVGLPGNAVREARERIRVALRAGEFSFPQDRVLINLSPADLPKTGCAFDLPMALALLFQAQQIHSTEQSFLALGELGLEGQIRAVSGVLPAICLAKKRGVSACLVPLGNLQEALCCSGIRILGASCLKDLVTQVHESSWQTAKVEKRSFDRWTSQSLWPFYGQKKAKLSLEVAAAGGHSLLLYGPPGCGKTLGARSLETLLPPLTEPEALQVTQILSLDGKLFQHPGLVYEPPFRSPHHSASVAGLLGGGKTFNLGEVTLAHRGVLLLDEAPEFSPKFLQALREPLEDGKISLVRAERHLKYPARFQLVLTANACPCGQLGREKGLCLCGPQTIRRYWDRLGGALIDRIDLRVFMRPEKIIPQETSQAWEITKTRLERAWERQKERKEKNAWTENYSPDLSEVPQDQRLYLQKICQREDWSARAVRGLLRVARTLADLDGQEMVQGENLEQAVELRKPDGQEYWQS